MRHPIDPKIDCVFKALLGAESNRALLVHFLNAMLGPDLPAPIVEVAILNPYNEREFLDDKLSVVDVKARDDRGALHQVEIQLVVLPELPARVLYGWTDLYSSQLASGEDYSALRPTYAIWLLGETLLPDLPGYAHRYRMCDEAGRSLVAHGGIALFELGKFAAERIRSPDGTPVESPVENEAERWLKFFVEGERLDPAALPDWMQTPEMRQAMSTLTEFSEKEREYHAYQARASFLRQQKSIARRIEALTEEAARARARAAEEQARAAEEQARAAEEQARAAEARERIDKERERAAKEAALAEIARLKTLIERNDG